MNWKLVFVGGIVFWLVTNILGMFVTGILIHEKILDPVYQAHESFWLPELTQDPPDMAALMPRWPTTSLVSSLVVAGIYSLVRGSFSGPGWMRGMKWGGARASSPPCANSPWRAYSIRLWRCGSGGPSMH